MRTNRFMFSGIAVLTIVSATLGDDYQIDRYTVDAGGGYSAGGSIEMEGTIGQPDAGTLSGGTFMLSGGFWAGQASPDGEPIAIVSVNSCLLHDDGGPSEIELCIDLLAQTNPVEPRVGGPDTLVFGFSGDVDGATVVPENVQITCAGGPAGSFQVVQSASDAIAVLLDAPLADVNCCTFAFAGVQSVNGGLVDGQAEVMVLSGDLDFNGGVTGGDASLIKPHFGEIAGVDLSSPQWDFDHNGGVTGGDFSLIKPLFDRVAPACP